MGQYVDFYCGDENKELKKIVNPILIRRFAWIPQKDYDDFYSIASEVVWDCEEKFDGTKKFKSFVSTCIHNKVKSYITHMNRDKRMAKDEDGNPLHNSSLDAHISDEDSTTLGDYIDGDFCVEDEVIGDNDEMVECCLNALPNIQRKIIELKMEDISVENIKQQLNLSNSEYENHIKTIKENRTVIDFKAKRNKNAKKAEVKIMRKTVNEETIQVMDIDTTDSYRRDNNTLSSLLDDISDELSPTYINRDYISQRQPFMWSEEQINKFYTRILNNQPIPEIIVCEQVVDGQKISFLIDGLQRLSYAELFKNNIRPVKAKGAEFTHIKYKKRIVDEDGNIKVVEELFDIVGKKYEDLPEFLQKRFDNFNVSVTRFFNCTSEMIDYHIRNYNSHTSMNKVQYSATNASNLTVGNIKRLSQKHSFFKDIVKINNKNVKDGSWDEVVGRAIMTTYFLDDWKREVKDVFMFLDENATTEQFKTLKGYLDRLSELIGGNSLNELFTTGNTHIWLAVYDKFTKLGLDDSKFIAFMRKFKDDLHMEETTDFIKNVYKSRHSRDKSVIVGKIDGLYELLCEFLHINSDDLEEVDTIDFIKENVKADAIEEDVEFYSDMLDDLTLEVDNDTKLLDKHNRPSLIALVGYACENEYDDAFTEWIKRWFSMNNSYILNQKNNFLHMKQDFDNYLEGLEVA